MKILTFPTRSRRGQAARERLTAVESLLRESLGRQISLREDGRRLQASLARLSALTGDIARTAERLQGSVRRLRSCRPGAVPRAPIP